MSATPVVGETLDARFRPERVLMSGADRATLLGADLLWGDRVVIKSIPSSSIPPTLEMRLRREAAALSGLSSPLLKPPRHVARHDGFVYVVAEFAPGLTLKERLRRGPLTVREALDLGRGLARALAAAHGAGVLHRGVKPSNVIVPDGSSLARVTLVDFGLPRGGDVEYSDQARSVEAALYRSPEQAGLIDRGLDESSDLYAAGIVLFECVAGRPPFGGTSVGEIQRQHLTAPLPELGGMGLAAPRALDEVVQRLLQKDPRARYRSAGTLEADLAGIADALDRGEEPVIASGARERAATLTDPAFVGREDQLSVLRTALARARTGAGTLVMVIGESGAGKTRLLDEFARECVSGGARVLRGQGQEAGHHPFQVLGGVVEALRSLAASDPTIVTGLRRRLGDRTDAALAAIPELESILGSPAGGPAGPEAFGEARTLAALAVLLDAFGTDDAPAAVLLDDCQWADELTIRLLEHWSGGHTKPPAGRPVMVVAAFRPEDFPVGTVLGSLAPAATVAVTPLEPDDLRRVVTSMAGPVPEEAHDVIAALSRGSPFMAWALLQGMVESGVLVGDDSGWRIEPSAKAGFQPSIEGARFLARRLDRLPRDVLRLLSAGAIVGREFDLDLAAALSSQAPARAVAALEEAVRRQIVWTRSQDRRCVFAHDKLREAVLDRLTPNERRNLHLLAAFHIEARDRDRAFDLADHFEAAGQPERALRHALAAAETARARHALDIAERYFRMAEKAAPVGEPESRRRVAEGLGDVLMLRGKYDEAEERFRVADSLAEGNLDRASIRGKLGELAFKRGDVRTASHTIIQALRLLGRRIPSRPAVLIVLALWEMAIQLAHTWMPGWFLGRRPLQGAEADLLAVRLYGRLGYAWWFERGKVATLWTHLRGMNLAERYGPSTELARTYSEHAPAMLLVPWFRRGIAYAERSRTIGEELRDLWGQGQSLHFNGVVLYAASRFAESLERHRQALALLERTGDQWEVNSSRVQAAMSFYRLGELRLAVEEARIAHEAGLRIGDAQARGISLEVWAKASNGRVPSELVQAELGRSSEDVLTMGSVLQAEGVRLLGEGRAADAVQTFERAQRLFREAGMKNAGVSPIRPWLATALRRQAEDISDPADRLRSAVLRRAGVIARQARRRARLYRNDLPHALRELGLLAALHGRERRARRLLAKSLAVADRHGARYERLETLRARGEVGVRFGWPGAADDVSAARGGLETIAPPEEEVALASR